jgi:hypothetical protein
MPHSSLLRRVRLSFLLFCLPSFPIRIWRTPIRDPSPIEGVATPQPLLRMSGQPSLHRIEMHVIQLLVLFLPALHVEVVEPPLPKRAVYCPPQSPPQVTCHSEWSVPCLCFCAKRRDTQSRNLSSIQPRANTDQKRAAYRSRTSARILRKRLRARSVPSKGLRR